MIWFGVSLTLYFTEFSALWAKTCNDWICPVQLELILQMWNIISRPQSGGFCWHFSWYYSELDAHMAQSGANSSQSRAELRFSICCWSSEEWTVLWCCTYFQTSNSLYSYFILLICTNIYLPNNWSVNTLNSQTESKTVRQRLAEHEVGGCWQLKELIISLTIS